MQRVFGRRRVIAMNDVRIADPADLDATEQIGLRARELVEPARLEMRIRPEDLEVRLEAHGRAAPVLDRAQILQLRDGHAALIALHPEVPVARDFDFQPLRQRVDDRRTHAVKAAAGLIGTLLELAARVQRRHDDFERGLRLELGVRVHGNAATIVAHAQDIVVAQLDFDARRMAGDSFVHGVVDDFRRKVVQGALVRAADIHARTAADRLKTLEDLDVFCRVALRSLVLVVLIEQVRLRNWFAHFYACHRGELNRGGLYRFRSASMPAISRLPK